MCRRLNLTRRKKKMRLGILRAQRDTFIDIVGEKIKKFLDDHTIDDWLLWPASEKTV